MIEGISRRMLAPLLLLLAAAALGEAGEDYTIRRGDSLDAIAARIYGHRSYAILIELHNAVKPASLAVGTRLDLPDLAVLLRAEKLGAVLPEPTEAILRAKTAYQSVEARLWELRRAAPGNPIPDEVRQQLQAAADALDQAAAGFAAPRPEVGATPKSMIGQLRAASEILRSLAAGKFDEYGYDLDLVHQHLSKSLSYGIIWAKNGFR